jgi:hypothetical protein
MVFGRFGLINFFFLSYQTSKNMKNNFDYIFYLKTNSHWFLIWVDSFNLSKMKIKKGTKKTQSQTREMSNQ